MVLLHLQKAFHTVNNDILLFKLRALGFKDDVSKWISSFKTCKEQVVIVNGMESDAASIHVKVSHGHCYCVILCKDIV